MKKIILAVVLALLLPVFGTVHASGETGIKVTVDGKNVVFPDARPYIDENGRTLIPVRFVSEELGAKVDWDQGYKTTVITKNDTHISIRINEQDIVINGEIKTMDTKAVLKEGRTFVPIRYVAEALGATVDWNNSTRTVIISTRSIIVPKAEDFYRIKPDMPSELYTYPYRKQFDGWYATNKWMVGRFGNGTVRSWMKIAKDYVEDCYTVDYRSLDKDEFIKKLKWYFLNLSWFGNDGVRRSVDEHLNYWTDMVLSKKIVLKTQFNTDTSLVVSNGCTLIRGRAVYTIDNCTDMDLLNGFLPFGCKGELKKENMCDLEIELADIQGIDDWEHAPLIVSNEYVLSVIK